MLNVNVHEAQIDLSNLIQRVLLGEEIIITQAGTPIAILAPIKPLPAPRIPGNDADTVIIHPDFDDPLPEFVTVQQLHPPNCPKKIGATITLSPPKRKRWLALDSWFLLLPMRIGIRRGGDGFARP